MEKLQDQKLTTVDKYILQKYADGYTYDQLQQDLWIKFELRFDKRKLGWKMGELKKKMKCATQFEMGYKYAQDSITEIFESMKEDHQIKLEEETKESFFRGLTFGRNQTKIMSSGKETTDGVKTGIFLASIFWIVIMISAYYIYLA